MGDCIDASKFLRSGGPSAVRLEGVTDVVARKLAACAHLAKVTSLDLTGGRIGEKGARALAESPHVRQLTSLSISQCHAKDAVLIALSRSSALTSLRTLDLEWNEFGARGWKALTSTAALPALVDLRARCNDLGPKGWTTLLASPLMERLEAVDLSETRPGRLGLDALFSSSPPRLRRLKIVEVELDGRGIKRLLEWPTRVALTALDVGHNVVTAEVAAKLFRAPWPVLEELGLRATCIGVQIKPELAPRLDAFEALAHPKAFPALRSLDLSATDLSPDAARVLARAPCMALLEALNLAEMPVDESLEILLASPRLGRLARLDVRGTNLSDRGALALARSKNLGALVHVDAMQNPRIGAEGHRALRARFGKGLLLPPKPTPQPKPEPVAAPKRPAKVKRLPLANLARIARSKPFAHWRPMVTAKETNASTALMVRACRQLMALGEDASPAAQKKVLRACVVGSNALYRKHEFIQTTEAEDISEVIDNIADHTSFVGAQDFAGQWRDW